MLDGVDVFASIKNDTLLFSVALFKTLIVKNSSAEIFSVFEKTKATALEIGRILYFTVSIFEVTPLTLPVYDLPGSIAAGNVLKILPVNTGNTGCEIAGVPFP